ncbi:Dihydrolipoamide acetyltransferase E2 component of pyruvate dehydrogenase complex [Candidatus Zixiibacteriota bacterium]|nr:Dihydrolipoamide acetyltransferase E2 component of pyruvate dehydrogenase complex [candidate division Zixibacteria bacterium]
MEYKVVVPPLGESVVEGTIVKWLKKEGDKIKIDDPIVEIMTDKINVEIPSPHDGVMKKHLVPIDTVVQIGAEIAIMEIEGTATVSKAFQTLPDSGKEVIPPEQDVKAPPEEFVGTVAHHEQMGIHADKDSIEAGIKAVKSSPIVRRLAREHFIDLRLVKGSGRDSRVSKEDIIKYINSRHQVDKKKPDFVFPDAEHEEIIPVTGVRKVIAEHMVKSAFSIPHVTTFDECDMTRVIEWRKTYVDKIEKTHGVRITYLPFMVKAIIFAAKEFPWLNATFEKDEMHIKKYFNIGMAVARNNSLIVPVVKHCEQKSILQIAREMKELADKANADKLSMDEISGGTFSITNAGIYGALGSTPIIAAPQVAILGVHKIVDKPVVRDGQIVVRPILNFGLSFDHRVIDGGYAVQFLRRMIEYLEDPDSWLLGVI